ncbi:uncharacterized protein LOC111074967 [Drosophila obscura]|uniref:uncharacterized protein LOC111074967 n=1 Tax=Drosophila obscura TaxID=7282 RepID=UPI001BB15709|nr:uncharacterized protein LOC111074967 [Drosophila obscura]XP_022223687.2 uncharacterized protein LOC111074967 [Drosophila obscura]XP_022223688.2 uncharacterized protein LOC111074967 [Drosophila obscura]XP_022223690.2 uncharacterized protein LOC111074967 [Drosophila obscura]
MAEQKTVDFLWNCANKLTGQSHAERLIKSHYITTCRKFARHNVQLPEDSFGAARLCARCGNQWTDGNYQLHLQPQRLADTAKRRRLIAKLETAKASQQKGLLSTAARNRAKWLRKHMASNVVVDCAVCQHKTMLPLEKRKGKKRGKGNDETIANPTSTALGEAAATNQHKGKNKKIQSKEIKAVPKIPQQVKAKATTSPAHPTKSIHPAAAKHQTPKQKKKTKTAQSAPSTQSKTQKQNALLQLAAQLKSHAFKDASKSQQNRLQAFLK